MTGVTGWLVWVVWAGLGVVASTIRPAVKQNPLLLFAFSSALDDFQHLTASRFAFAATSNISILAAFAPTGPIIRDLAHHNAAYQTPTGVL